MHAERSTWRFPGSRGASARSTGKNARKTKSPAKAELDAFDDIDYDV